MGITLITRKKIVAVPGGGETYATYNPADKSANITLSNGNLTATGTDASWKCLRATQGLTSGKWYWEVTVDTLVVGAMVGVANSSAALTNYCGVDTNGWSYAWTGSKYHGSPIAYGSAFTVNDVLSIALNMDTGKIWFRFNGTWQAGGDPVAGTGEAYSGITGTIYPADSPYSTSALTVNYGQSAFSYSVPSGFNAGVYV